MSPTRSEGTTVRFFEELYAIIVGLGLALAIEQLIDLNRDGIPLTTEHVPLFLAYLNLAFPLAHSSVRYLDLAFIDKAAGQLGKARVLGDLALGMGHFLFLITLSFLVTRPSAFAVAAILLLVGRPGRDAIVMMVGGKTLAFDRKVASIHLATIGLLVITLLVALVADGDGELWILRVGVLAASFVFALGLYLGAFDFFFSTKEES